ncbi:unnamed protein product [Chondrus crispus]|uniref:Bystin n=1 Tax=Chondrus crispus TaxID=2769 RepID=R7QN80_CHOCR|nr:unnamed protein product [Chondrus crispus]CDF38845.1 unnamed protein product [Chondrus crispus]|eukprot:XP_005718750.1 unnamed protein product [Chondrus crispus]
MGKKRTRSTATAKPANGDAFHAQSFVDDVREARDVEFAAQKKQQERLKRRKLTEDLELAAAKTAAKATKKAIKAGKPLPSVSHADARKAGLQMWKRAALRRKARAGNVDDEDFDGEIQEDVVDSKTTAKIFKEAKEQRAEIREENINSVAEEAARNCARLDSALEAVGEKVHATALDDSDQESGDDSKSDVPSEGTAIYDERELAFLDGSKVTEEDEMALALFTNMENKGTTSDEPQAAPGTRMLADIILDKIREKEEADARAAAIAADPERAARDKRIAEVYGLVGNILSRYRSGKVPKAFKVIPKLRNWEEVLYLTRPDEWSSAAVYAATRLLASNLPAREVISFYTDILLPRCLEDISENKKLNYHLYRALAKAVYKPDAFNKGILFPICEDIGCTLRQATIIGSVISKVSIPMLHSAAALLYIVQLPYTPSNSIIITALLEKKYALPYQVLDAVVASFLKMKSDTRSPPLIWHQSLLAFAQRYKMDVTMEQKERLKLLMRVHTHYAVTPEIRRELFSSRNRGDLMDPDSNTIARNLESAAMVM